MANSFFQFRQFRLEQDQCAMKITTDACILGAWAPAPDTGNILDIGTGTGLLTCMLAQRTAAAIDAIEIDADSYRQAKENFSKTLWRDRLQLFHGDARRFASERRYDFIICNPPFFENQLPSPSDAKNKARHSSFLSLSELAEVTDRLLDDDGKFAVLIPAERTEDFIKKAALFNLFLNKQLFIRSHPHASPFRIILVMGRKPVDSITESMLTIYESENVYSSDFTALLRDFYLHL